jgi:hypothetical protein
MVRRTRRQAVAVVLLMLSSLSVAASPEQFDGAIEQAQPRDALRIDGGLFHVQGLALSPAHIWATSVDLHDQKAYLHKFDRATGRLLRRLEVTEGARYHPGGISVSGGSIWVPVAEMRPDSSAVLIEVDAQTLQIRRRIEVADHLGCVAATGQTLVAGNWDSRLFYVFDLAKGAVPRVVPNPSPTHYQDMKFVGRQLVAGGSRSLWSGTVDWIDWPSVKVVRSLRTGPVGVARPLGQGGAYSGEGMAVEGRDLYFLAEDNAAQVHHFMLDA